LQSAASGRIQKLADTISPPPKLLFPLPCIPSRVGEGKEKGASNLLPSHVRQWKEKEASILLSTGGREGKRGLQSTPLP
jgi:hypothetical protein